MGAFLDAVPDERRRADARRLVALAAEVTGEPPVLWGTAIVGFGSRHYRYASGHEGDTPLVGVSPRKQHTSVYLSGAVEEYADLLERLGPHGAGRGCLNLRRLDDLDTAVLREVLARSVEVAARLS